MDQIWKKSIHQIRWMPARGRRRASPVELTLIYIRLRARIIEHFFSAGRDPGYACGCSRMFDYVYTDHAHYTIKTYAKMAVFRLVLTGPLSTTSSTAPVHTGTCTVRTSIFAINRQFWCPTSVKNRSAGARARRTRARWCRGTGPCARAPGGATRAPGSQLIFTGLNIFARSGSRRPVAGWLAQ